MSDAPADDGRLIDLDAARQARTETKGPAPRIRLDGEVYDLPAELPMEAILVLAEDLFDKDKPPQPDAVRAALAAVLGDHYERLRTKLSVPDAMTLLTGVLKLYGTDLGELRASGTS